MKRVEFHCLVEERRVHSSIYTDPAIFDMEMDRIFHRGWVYVGHQSEVPNKGDFRMRPIGKQPVIMVRGEDGEVRILMNRCTHRGTQVCVHERGNAKRFTCAYHGWSFSNSGRLMGVPKRDGYGSGFRTGDYSLRSAPRVGHYRGLIFASLHPEGLTLDEYLGPLVKAEIDVALDLSPVGELDVNAGIHKYGYDGNWKLQLENSVDGYHVNFLHRSYLQIAAKRGSGASALTDDGSLARTRSLGNGHVMWDLRPVNRMAGRNVVDQVSVAQWRKDHRDSLVAKYGEARTQELLTAGQAHIAVFPNLVLLGEHIRTYRPISVDRTEVFLYPTLLRSVPDEVNQERLRIHEAFYGPAGGGATDDLEIFERVSVGLRATVDPWIDLSRGLERQTVDADGALVCNITDDLGSRAILRHWRDVMSGAENSSSPASIAGLTLTRHAG
jgi:phenylpropionate dioxygenase-like ring-hydroxylating dioxygenase large terminal subunit